MNHDEIRVYDRQFIDDIREELQVSVNIYQSREGPAKDPYYYEYHSALIIDQLIARVTELEAERVWLPLDDKAKDGEEYLLGGWQECHGDIYWVQTAGFYDDQADDPKYPWATILDTDEEGRCCRHHKDLFTHYMHYPTSKPPVDVARFQPPTTKGD